MGMFDTLLIDIDLLPISATDKERLRDETFQTKSLENSMLTYRISSNTLEIDQNSGFTFREKEEGENWTTLEITDAVKFYTSLEDNDEWFEFVALFDKGKLLVIRRVI